MRKLAGVFALFLMCSVASAQTSSLNTSTMNGQGGLEDCIEEVAYISPSGQAFTKTEYKEALVYMLKTGSCSYKGIKLYGKVKFVTSFPDIKIQYVSSFPDIKVQFVDSFPDKCGKWKEVSSFPDFKVEVVSSFPDLKVKKVTSFPGMN
ncbi:hypothetical protein [Microscilla marina]|uniref:7(1) septoil knot domain-containing protein n=1 Tax=Microscilla marina ATCC 23134 TaxID=313606 RepID=A1ZQH7_MICM2|nr:hypothetical protein [Microscilla marina]EAY27349.1 conserved hypothetical protein [Microscilla marina ATCC 23134]